MGSISVGYLPLRLNGSKTGSNGAGSSGSNTAAATTWPKLHLLLASLALDQKSKLLYYYKSKLFQWSLWSPSVVPVIPVVLVVSTSGSSGPDGPHQWFQWS